MNLTDRHPSVKDEPTVWCLRQPLCHIHCKELFSSADVMSITLYKVQLCFGLAFVHFELDWSFSNCIFAWRHSIHLFIHENNNLYLRQDIAFWPSNCPQSTGFYCHKPWAIPRNLYLKCDTLEHCDQMARLFVQYLAI